MGFVDSVRTGFSRTFWVANVLELFERFAFYGSKAVLTVYIAEQVGLGPESASWLAGLYGTLIFFLPVLAGTIVDRYGFKRSLLACFAVFCVGYFLIGLAGLPIGKPLVDAFGPTNWVLMALVITASGGSLIKPCIVGTVARTTTDETRSLGYSIYYSLVNLGGAIGPVLAMLVRTNVGISWVLVMSSAVSLLLCAATLLLYREPPRPANAPPARSMGKVLRDMVMVFGNLRFITFLVIFSGFWVMFWHVFYALPFYVKDYLQYEKFELIETVGAATIVALTVPLTALARRLRPLTAMTLGFALATACWFLMATFPTLVVTVIALCVFAIGEATQAPRYYEYVADLAPQDQVGTYMGFAFLPIAIGTFGAGASSGFLVKTYVEGGNPNAPDMWLWVGSYGVIATILMLLYDRFLAPHRSASVP